MSAQALGAPAASGAEAGELAAAQRVQQLQTLIEASRQVASPALGATTDASASYPQGTSGDFASALQAATSADAAATGTQAAGLGQPGTGSMIDAAYQPGASAGTMSAAYQPNFQSAAGSAEGGEYEALIDQAAARYGLDPAVLHGLIQQESGFDPSAASSAGATGLTQLMPGTASSLGVANPLDPAESIEGGARYLSEMMAQFGGNTADALAAYNAGPGAVQQYGGVPPYAETESYVSNVLSNAEAYRQSHPTTATTGTLA
jgi:soluble lytic murein transglycosylase-like protein